MSPPASGASSPSSQAEPGFLLKSCRTHFVSWSGSKASRGADGSAWAQEKELEKEQSKAPPARRPARRPAWFSHDLLRLFGRPHRTVSDVGVMNLDPSSVPNGRSDMFPDCPPGFHQVLDDSVVFGIGCFCRDSQTLHAHAIHP